jgi:hypothetical protein
MQVIGASSAITTVQYSVVIISKHGCAMLRGARCAISVCGPTENNLAGHLDFDPQDVVLFLDPLQMVDLLLGIVVARQLVVLRFELRECLRQLLMQ